PAGGGIICPGNGWMPIGDPYCFSFFIQGVKDPREQLIKPALEGTQNVLDTVNETPTVKRVVLTSSVAAIYGDAIDIKNTRQGISTKKTGTQPVLCTTNHIHIPKPWQKKMPGE
ncbi:MAG: hypothetical protein HC819_23265, partial [Cyclobacteriaceae bacterium]|nr:hypothetical protein [Cyclobacteriaceae bacterium]